MISNRRKRKPTVVFSELNGDDRLRELILYIAERCEDDPTFGATKLNKILWFSDFIAYLYHAKPITGVEYQRLPNGPAPRRLLPIRAKMEAAREIVVRKPKGHLYTRHTVIALREPNLDDFSKHEVSLVDEVIRKLWGKSAAEISDLSHLMAWKSVRDKESIPYEAAFLSDDPLSEYDRSRTAELAHELGWRRAASSRVRID